MEIDPFPVLPKEVWEMILKFLLEQNPAENSKDVLSFMHAYPVFETEFASLKEDCLILQVLYVLDKKDYLDFNGKKAIVKCRQYNKRWCRVVDAYLNCQPGKDVDEYVQDFHVDNWFFDHNGEREGTRTVFDFMKDFKEQPASRNPFVVNKRRIIVRAMPYLATLEGGENEWEEVYPRDRDSDCRSQEIFMEELIKMLDKFGKHIWNLEFDYDCSFFGLYNQPLFWTNIDKILKFVPNLKYFRLCNYSDDDFESLRKLPESAFQYLKISLPDLPRLEELGLAFCTHTTYQSEVNLWSNLLQRYASNLKVLQLDANERARRLELMHPASDVFKFVEIPSASVSFPLLKKLTYRDGASNKKSLTYFFDQLLSWNAPNLKNIRAISQYKFRYEQDPAETDPAINSGNEWKKLLQKLKRFPILKRFQTNYSFVQEEDLSVEEDSHLSLESLHLIGDPNASYKMLLCFPNLVHLKIQSDIFPTVHDFSVNTAVKISEEMQTGQIFKSNIWQLLGNLKTFTLLSAPLHSYNRTIVYLDKPFTRENYEKFNKETAIKNAEGDPLRPDILKYLIHQVKENCRGCCCCSGHPQSTTDCFMKDDLYITTDDDDD